MDGPTNAEPVLQWRYVLIDGCVQSKTSSSLGPPTNARPTRLKWRQLRSIGTGSIKKKLKDLCNRLIDWLCV